MSERGMCNMDASCAARRVRRDHHIGWALTRRHGTAIGLGLVLFVGVWSILGTPVSAWCLEQDGQRECEDFALLPEAITVEGCWECDFKVGRALASLITPSQVTIQYDCTSVDTDATLLLEVEY